MANIPYLWIGSTVLSASSQGSISFPVNAAESMMINKFVFVATGAFSVIGIRDSDGNPYSNCSLDKPILSTMLQNSANGNLSMRDLLENILIKANKTLYIDLLDTSAAQNTVRFLLQALRVTA